MDTSALTGLVIVDGNNVVGCVPDGWWRDKAAAKARLYSNVEAWIASKLQDPDPPQSILVFDGHPISSIGSVTDHLEVVFANSSAKDAADDLIVALVTEKVDNGVENMTVVTSDRGLRSRLPPEVSTLGSKSFRLGLPEV